MQLCFKIIFFFFCDKIPAFQRLKDKQIFLKKHISGYCEQYILRDDLKIHFLCLHYFSNHLSQNIQMLILNYLYVICI